MASIPAFQAGCVGSSPTIRTMNKAVSETYITDTSFDWLERNFPIGCTVSAEFPEGTEIDCLGEIRAHFINLLNEPCATVKWDNGKEDDFNEAFLMKGPIIRV